MLAVGLCLCVDFCGCAEAEETAVRGLTDAGDEPAAEGVFEGADLGGMVAEAIRFGVEVCGEVGSLAVCGLGYGLAVNGQLEVRGRSDGCFRWRGEVSKRGRTTLEI